MKYLLLRIARAIYSLLVIFALVLLFIRYIFIQEINNLLFDDEIRNLILVFTTLVGFFLLLYDLKGLLNSLKKETDKNCKIKKVIPFSIQKVLCLVITIIISTKFTIGMLESFYVLIILCGLGNILSEMISLLTIIIAGGYHLQVSIIDHSFVIYSYIFIILSFMTTGFGFVRKGIVLVSSIIIGLICFFIFKFSINIVYLNLLSCFIGSFFIILFGYNIYFDIKSISLYKSNKDNYIALADETRY